MKIEALIQSTRVPFLLLTPVCVFLGVSAVISDQDSVDLFLLSLALIGGILAHISVNTLNEYFDFRSGLDLETIKTPFSGGSGALPQNPEMAAAVLKVGIVSLVAAMSIGVVFTWMLGLGIAPIGILGILLIVAYTQWINRYPFLCLVAPGVGFGFLMVVGTAFVLQGEYSATAGLAAIVPFFLVNNLLLLNQYPDISADRNAGRNHLSIAYGTAVGNAVYAFFVAATVVAIIACVLIDAFPLVSLVALLPIPLAYYSLRGAMEHGEAIGAFPQYLGTNVAVTMLVPLLLGVSLAVG